MGFIGARGLAGWLAGYYVNERREEEEEEGGMCIARLRSGIVCLFDVL